MYTPLNKVTLSKDNLVSNYNYLKSLNPSLELFPNLKSNAYGHGIVEIGMIIDTLGCKYICVDSLYEAYELYNSGINTAILITGFVDSNNLKVKNLPFAYVVWDDVQIKNILNFQPHAKFHLFIDTGMNREGIRHDELEGLASKIKDYSNSIEGVMSHFASADNQESSQSEMQLLNFSNSLKLLENHGFNFKYKHISASACILNNYNSSLNSARLGLSLYGVDPMSKDGNLKPVLELKTQIVQIKDVKQGESIGYSATFTAAKDMRIGILPIGYNDGVDRRLSNKGYVLVNGNNSKILGRVSMNITAIDLTDIDTKVNNEVTIYSNNSEAINSIDNCAKLCDTISYELLVHINASTKRIVKS